MRDEILLAMSNDPENYWEDGVLYGPGFGDRVVLITVNTGAAKDYSGPVPRWVTRRGFKLWDVIGSQYDTEEAAIVITPDGFRPVDSPVTYSWSEALVDYGHDLDTFFEGLVKFTR